MEQKALLTDTQKIRRTILSFDSKLVASAEGYIPGKKQSRKITLQYALYLLDYAERIFDSDQGSAVASMGMAVGMIIVFGIMIEPETYVDPFLSMPSANAMPA